MHQSKLSPLMRRGVMGGLRLRAPSTHFWDAELAMIARAAAGATTAVEIGVAEGVSARVIRSAMDPGGVLHLVDPFFKGRFGLSWSRVVAGRFVERGPGAQIHWIRALSTEAARTWRGGIDLLNIDGRHTWEGALEDWRDWSPFVRVGGTVVFAHDIVPGESLRSPGAVTLERLQADGWECAAHAEERVALTRVR